MAAPETVAPPHDETSVERFEHELEALEGVGVKKRWGRWIFGALILAGVVAAFFIFGHPQKRMGVTAIGGAPVLELSEPRGGKLAAPPSRFRWESISGRSSYQFKLSLAGSPAPILDKTVKESTLDLTPEEKARMVAGSSYVWQVEAKDKTGRNLAAGKGFFDL